MTQTTDGPVAIPAASAPSAPHDLLRIAQAFDFAARAHVDQLRKGVLEEPYLNHLAEVAYLVAQATGGGDANVIIAALLHDTLEDQPKRVTLEGLVQTFGEDVACLVSEVTDDKTLLPAERKRLQIETAPHKSARAKLIKIADKTANLRSLATSPPKGWSDERKREYVLWSSRVVAGCSGVNQWLEDQYAQACMFANSPPEIRLAKLREALAGLPVTPAYREALLASVDQYSDQILVRPEFGAGWDDLMAVEQVTLGDAVEAVIQTMMPGAGPTEVQFDFDNSGAFEEFDALLAEAQGSLPDDPEEALKAAGAIDCTDANDGLAIIFGLGRDDGVAKKELSTDKPKTRAKKVMPTPGGS